MLKFKTEKEIASIRGDQVETKRGCMLVTKAAMKQPEVITLETLEEWDR